MSPVMPAEVADPAAPRDAIAPIHRAPPGDEDEVVEAGTRAIVAARGDPQQEARAQFEQDIWAVERPRQMMPETTDTSLAAVPTSALLGVLGLILGALAAWFGVRRRSADHPASGGMTFTTSEDSTMISSDTTSVPKESLELVEETAHVGIRDVVTGRVRIETRTELHDEVLHRDLHGIRIETVRVPVDRMLAPGEAPALTRTEGAVTIIPIYEEVVVTETRIVLKEELHITQYETTKEIEIPVTLRKQVATIERSTSED